MLPFLAVLSTMGFPHPGHAGAVDRTGAGVKAKAVLAVESLSWAIRL
jgi:hypothetical protein